MKSKLNRKEAQEEIKNFFDQKDLEAKYVKKIKRLAMKDHIRLKEYKKRFCKACLSDLKQGKVRITKIYKSVECGNCGERNRWKL